VKPGDFIEWVYQVSQNPVADDEMLWSNVTKAWVPIGGIAMLICIDDRIFTWISSKGVFSGAPMDVRATLRYRVEPRILAERGALRPLNVGGAPK
jgi:hypothetical protein